MADKKEKKYLIDNPTLMTEWNWEKNNELSLDPNTLTLGSGKKVWWICRKGHEWQATIFNRSQGKGCPYCSNKKVLKGYNDLSTLKPTLVKEWNYERNDNLKPEEFTVNSHQKVWWKCSKGHEWQATIASRNDGRGCPCCANQKIIKGYNDIVTINPKLASEWNYERNGDLKPENFTVGSDKKVWWKCDKGHEWLARIADRNNGKSCPYCANQKIIKGYNDLATINPTLVREWNYERNGNLKPENLAANSNKKAWWKCDKGHEWQAVIGSRNKGAGCPICNSERHTSFPEYAIVFYLEKYGFKVAHSYKQKKYELDIYIPSKNIAIEYDGSLWHKNKKEKDLEKNFKCKKDGIKLYRIREGLPVLNDSSIDYIVDKNQKNLSVVLRNVLSEITGKTIDVDLNRDTIEIESLRIYTEKTKSLLYANPTLAKEWNYKRNGNLKPENISPNSGKKVWWKCDKGHEWLATINNRNNGRGCPICASHIISSGFNDLSTLNPTLAKEWSYERNIGLKPEDFTANSHKKVWWKCDKGHEWQATIASRNRGNSCPYCSGRYATKGKNDLSTLNPTLVKEWNYEKNVGLKPEEFTANSGKKVWWKCGKGHEWQATINSRNNGRGCPYCSGKKVLKGFNDLATINQTLAKEWNYEKNGDLKPENFTVGSDKKVWWKCDKGHEWQATISNRNKGSGCPICYRFSRLKKDT